MTLRTRYMSPAPVPVADTAPVTDLDGGVHFTLPTLSEARNYENTP